MHWITVAERRARLAVRHHVAPSERVSTVLQAARDMVCLHASDPSSVYLSARARMTDGTIEAVDRALFDDRELVRMLAMRRTMFVRSRPRGSWISSQYRWSTIEQWLGGPFEPIPVDEARAALVRRWLERFGPGTEADVRWWTGWSAGVARKAIADVGVETVDLEGATGYVLAGDVEATTGPGTWVALLPSLDPTTMGWQGRDWYLGPHKPFLFDTNGNAGPTIWVDGRIVGGWAVRTAGEVVTRFLEDAGRAAEGAVAAEAARLTEWYASVQSIPRFPAPLYRELVG